MIDIIVLRQAHLVDDGSNGCVMCMAMQTREHNSNTFIMHKLLPHVTVDGCFVSMIIENVYYILYFENDILMTHFGTALLPNRCATTKEQ